MLLLNVIDDDDNKVISEQEKLLHYSWNTKTTLRNSAYMAHEKAIYANPKIQKHCNI